jgi:hypothetical protein
MWGKFVSFIASCTLCIAVGAEGGIKNWVRNNRNDDDGFEYLRNWLIFVVTVASRILVIQITKYFLFDEPLKVSLKIFKISLMFRFDKL